jgi:hypothetical protein
MTSQKNYRVDSFVSGLAIKAPVKTVSLVNVVTLEGIGDNIGGYIVGAGDRVLLAAQTDPTQNGIWNVETSAWQRAGDFDGNRDIVGGTIIPVWRASMTDIVLYQVDGVPDPLTIGIDNIPIIVYYDPTLAGIPEAPIDSTPYVRQDASWVSESAGSLPAPSARSVLVGNEAGSAWIVAADITMPFGNMILLDQTTNGAIVFRDGANDITLRNTANVFTINASIGITHTYHIPDLWLNSPLFMNERAAAKGDNIGMGQFWTLDEVDNVPMFTSDAGTDQLLDPSRSDINVQNGNYTTVLADKGKTIRKESGGAGETFTIAAEASVNYKLGTFIAFDNDGGGTLTIDIDGADTLVFADDGTTGPRTLADGGFAVAFKNVSGGWKIAGRQLT